MSIPVCHRIRFAADGAPAIAVRFMALPEEARLLESRIGGCLDPAVASLEVDADARQATSAASMVKVLLGSVPAEDVSLAESVDRSQLVNVALKLDFCVAMAKDVRDPAPRLGEVLVRFQRAGSGQEGSAGRQETFCVTMTDPAADQDTDALVGLFTRALSAVLVTRGHASRLSVTQQPASEPVGSADAALAELWRALDAAGLASQADQLQAAFPDGMVAVPAGDALAA